MNRDPLSSAALTASLEAHPGWFIVTQVKANRVVYFTDDPAYQPPMDGDWYFVTHHLGDLPGDMTLRNCWGWRFNGGVFSDVREPDEQQKLESLLEANRRALLTLLRDKINRLREDLAPTCVLGDAVRAAKLREAQAYLSLGRTLNHTAAADPEAFPLLHATAGARGCLLSQAAELIVATNCGMDAGLVASELVRERFSAAIRAARTQDELIHLRERILDEVEPGSYANSAHFAYAASPMKPEDWQAPLSEVQRAHERARLRARLREIVNASRSRVHQGYLEDEALLRQKAKLAQVLLNNEGRKPADVDFSLLQGLADARGLDLVDAARLVLGTVNEADAILRSSERLKDRILASIDRMANLRDIQQVEQELKDAARSTQSAH